MRGSKIAFIHLPLFCNPGYRRGVALQEKKPAQLVETYISA